MILKKTFEVNSKDINAVIVELANEIKNGWFIKSINRCNIEYSPTSCPCTFNVTLTRDD